MNSRLIIFLLLFAQVACDGLLKEKSGKSTSTFTLISSQQSSVDFVNQVDDLKDFNILNYRNFYNGGGVAIGDINNDGLEDLYFTSNQHENRLYLNKGNWQFEDITEQSGVAGTRKWSTGVTMVDINNDGFLDIYVCNSGELEGDDRKNELFINNGDLTFSEQAQKWGLDSDAFSVHATFFDYDLDGDLDCFLLNNSFRSPDRVEFYQKTRDEVGKEGGDKLLRNDGNFFTDVTLEAGIHTSDIGFGLGVSVSDFNNDMLPDMYISNDFWERDYLYINQGNGTFLDVIESKISMTSMNSMGADVGDLNNDTYPEILTTDMLPPDNYRIKTMTQFEPFRMGAVKYDTLYHHQIMQNCLQLNRDGLYFQEIAHQAGVASSDWSWGALILDMDLDGWKDIFISNGIQRDITDFDFVEIITNKQVVDQIVSENKGFDFRDFLPFMPATKISNSAYINQQDLTFKEEAHFLGLSEPSFSNGSAYGDLDNDGDLDLVINNANMESFLYRNNTVEQGNSRFLKIQLKGATVNPLGIGAKVRLYSDGQVQESQHFLSRGFQSSVAPGIIFGMGKSELADSLVIIWPDFRMQVVTNVNSNQTIVLNLADANRRWTKESLAVPKLLEEVTSTSFAKASVHRENAFNDFQHEGLIYKMLSREGPEVMVGDVNGDKLEDIILLGAAGEPNKLFYQEANGSLTYQFQQTFVNDQHLEATCAALIDFDNDGDLDLLVGHGGNEFQKGRDNFQMRMYENDGKGNFSLNIQATPQVGGNLSCIVPTDIDGDGDMDLFIGARSVPGHYGLVPSSFLLLNGGNGFWMNITTEEFGKLGMVTGAVWSDIDQDGDPDLIVVGDWMPVTVFENTPGALKKIYEIENSHGWWSAIVAKDLDNDGDDDFILGNWGLNSKFQASIEKPLKLHVKDFDRNGKVEQILEWYPEADDVAYPFVSKDELVKFLPQTAQSIKSYKDFGSLTYQKLFTEEQRRGALQLTATTLESAILWNEGGNLRLEALPGEAQVSPVFSIVSEDVNGDGIMDILLFGNIYGLKPEAGRLDANKGVLLLGDESGKFKYLSNKYSGLYVPGEVRDAKVIKDAKGGTKIIIGRNDDAALIYQLNGVVE